MSCHPLELGALLMCHLRSRTCSCCQLSSHRQLLNFVRPHVLWAHLLHSKVECVGWKVTCFGSSWCLNHFILLEYMSRASKDNMLLAMPPLPLCWQDSHGPKAIVWWSCALEVLWSISRVYKSCYAKLQMSKINPLSYLKYYTNCIWMYWS